MKTLLLFICSVIAASATTLTGTLTLPNGTGANGILIFSLSQQGSLQATGGCGGPAQIVPTYQIKITVTNGALVSPPAIFGNDCMQPDGTWYNVQLQDTNGNQLFNDRWIITGSSIDIGTIISVVITGTTGSLGINNITDMVTKSTTQTISGSKTFTSNILNTGVVDLGSPSHPFSTIYGVQLITTTGLIAPTFNSQATGSSPAMQQQSGTFVITGAGNAAFQTVAATSTFNSLATGTTSAFQQQSGTFIIHGSGNAEFQTLTGGVATISPTFNSTATGATNAVQQQSGTFTITGAGDAAFQSSTVTNSSNAKTFHSTATGATNAIEQVGSTFKVTGAGDAQFSTVVANTTFNSQATGSTSAFQQYTGTFVITGAGNASFQSVTANAVIAPTFNSTATGATAAFQQQFGTFAITGAGDAAFQTIAANTAAIGGQTTVTYGGATFGLIITTTNPVANAAQFIDSTGNCSISPRQTGGIACSSDITMKKHVETLETSLQDVLKLRPVTYEWISEDTGSRYIGFIAQEVEKIYPGLVFTDKDTKKKSLAYVGMVPYLVRAVQEQQAEITELKKLIVGGTSILTPTGAGITKDVTPVHLPF